MKETEYIGILSSLNAPKNQKERVLKKLYRSRWFCNEKITVDYDICNRSIFINKNKKKEIRIDIDIFPFVKIEYIDNICNLYDWHNNLIKTAKTYGEIKRFIKKIKKTLKKASLFAEDFIKIDHDYPILLPPWFYNLKYYDIRQDYTIKFLDDFNSFEIVFDAIHLWRVNSCINIKSNKTITTDSIEPIYEAYAEQNNLIFCDCHNTFYNSTYAFYRLYPKCITEYAKKFINEERRFRTKDISDSGLYYIDHVTDKTIWLIPTQPVFEEKIELFGGLVTSRGGEE
jgi:hypothetical protein